MPCKHWKPSQPSTGKEDMDLRGEATTHMLLDQPNIPIYILKPILIPTVKRSSHPARKKSLYAAHRDRHRKLQLVKMQRSTDREVLSHNAHIYNRAPAPEAQGSSQRRR